MAADTIIGIIDIGKTNAKFALVDAHSRTEIAVRTMPNTVLMSSPYPHFDIDLIWDFIKRSIRELNQEHAIQAISITTHGACAALVDEDGNLALPVLDYEYVGPEKLAEDYAKARPDFSTSFSPRLPAGLNLGAQLYWQQNAFPNEFERARWIIPYPQYWGFRLCEIAATEITSMGCHTDMWNFQTNDYSDLVIENSWREKLPPMLCASDILGPVCKSQAEELGLGENVPVYCGIHDSNASLLPYLLDREAPFSVVSTGTWVIVGSPGGDLKNLDKNRDCLANIDVFGQPVPSARFMGGREFSRLIKESEPQSTTIDVKHVLQEEIILLPSIESGTGPFPQAQEQWSHDKNKLSPEVLYVVVSYYLALMTAECLKLSDTHGDIIVEGPFARNTHYLAMLSAATKNRICANAGSTTGTSIGAAALVSMEYASTQSPKHEIEYFHPDDTLDYHGYAIKWHLKNTYRNTP
ncbi:MAG: FGGY family carbohydrate kinase [Rhizobiaceae bacterium]